MRFGTWNVSSLYRAGSTKAPARELARYELDLVGCKGGYVGQTGHCKEHMIIIFSVEN